MAARSGMADLILRTRRMVNDAGSAIWSDDEDIQDVLDLHKQRVYREPLEHERTLVGSGTAEYTVYHSRYGNYEAGGTAYFQVEDSGGTQRGTADYTADYIAGIVTMAADQMSESSRSRRPPCRRSRNCVPLLEQRATRWTGSTRWSRWRHRSVSGSTPRPRPPTAPSPRRSSREWRWHRRPQLYF